MKKPTEKQVFNFRELFNVSVFTFWDMTGFDLIKFDNEFIRSGKGSMEETVQKRYGEEAVKLVKELISINPFSE